MRESNATLSNNSGTGLPGRLLDRLRRYRARPVGPVHSAAGSKQQLLVDQLPLVTYVEAVTPAGTVVHPSRQVEALLGYSVDDWLADPDFFAKTLHPGDRERVLAQAEECSRTGTSFACEYRLVGRDGRVIW